MALLVVGLGNPGNSYKYHRHNVGFMVVDRLHDRSAGSEWREKYSGHVARAIVQARDVTLLKPSTFMNLSGRAVQKALADLRVKLADVIVIHDDLDLAYGDVRVKVGGGHGGHNGLRDIIGTLGADFIRVRVGIGRPTVGEVEQYVLSGFTKDEQISLDDVLQRAADATEKLVAEGPDKAMNVVNTKPKAKKG